MNSRCYFIGTTLADNPVPHQFLALAKELVRRGNRVVILAPHRRVDLENHESNPAIYTWPSTRPTKLRDALFLRRLIRQHRPSCLIANFVAVNVMSVVGWLAQVPMRVAWYHTVSEQLARDTREAKWKQNLLRLRKRLVYGAATHVVANSAASAEDVQEVYSVPKSKCFVRHNLLSDPLRDFSLDSEPSPERLICVGRFFPSKGQDVLIRALAILRKKIPSVHVEFIGEGPAQKSCEQLACNLGVHENCTFLGRVEHGEVLRRMANAIATVVPSRNEAFGLVNIESLAVGTPVIASKVGGIVEIVREGLDGFLVPPDDSEKLVEKLDAILSDPNLRRKMHGNARQRFLSAFELRGAIIEQADWFESITADARHVPASNESLNRRPATLIP